MLLKESLCYFDKYTSSLVTGSIEQMQQFFDELLQFGDS